MLLSHLIRKLFKYIEAVKLQETKTSVLKF